MCDTSAAGLNHSESGPEASKLSGDVPRDANVRDERQKPLMRYNVTLATPVFELIPLDVEGACEAEAIATAGDRLLKERPGLRPLDVSVAKIIAIGSSPSAAA
jgi:hypothetical protein